MRAKIKKWFTIFVILCIAASWIAFFIQSTSLYDIHRFNFGDLISVKINDRGLNGGNDIIEISDNEKIQQLGHLIKTSVSLSGSDFNPKASHGLCELELISKENKTTTITLVNNDAGGIITSGQWNYKSDSLLLIILEELRK